MSDKAAITVNLPREEVERRWASSAAKIDGDGDVDAVRRANASDPRRKVYEGAPAVRLAAAG
jgi:hypothetical protein